MISNTNSKLIQMEEQSKEVEEMKISDIPLKENQKLRIVVTIEDGDITCEIAAKESPVPAEVIGALEIAKTDVMNSMTSQQTHQAANEELEMVTIKLTEEDFAMEGTNGQLTAQGYSVGDEITMPAQVAQMREMALANKRKSPYEGTDSMTKEDATMEVCDDQSCGCEEE